MSPTKKKKDLTLAGLNKLVQQQAETLKEQENQIMSLTETATIISDKLIELKKDEDGIIYSGALRMTMTFDREKDPVVHYPLVSRMSVNSPFIEFTYLSYVEEGKAATIFNIPPKKKKESAHDYILRLENSGEFNVISEQFLVGSIVAISSLNFFMYKQPFKDEEMAFIMPPAPENVLKFTKEETNKSE